MDSPLGWNGEKMKKNSLTIVMAILSVLLFAEEYSLKSLEFTLTKEVNDIFSIGATLKTEPNTNVISMYHGKVVDINRDSNNSTNLGKYVEIATIFNYYLSGENKKVEFHMIYSNLSSIAEDIDIGYEINTQKVIGITGEKSSPLMKSDDLMISMYTLSREFYLEYYTSNYSTEMLNLYWYSIVSILYGKIPNPNIFKYEEIDTENIDYNELE
ncbi:MAG TPA: hypothetical protein DDW88_08325, partial [Treponema sp.]|nr:hypothetical protein [Treponema sp.]